MSNGIDDRCKDYERQYDQRLLERLPVIVRIDGRAFHSYAKKATRPFCSILHGMMVDTVKGLIKEFHPLIGYTQSDEISLLFYQKGYDSQLPFGGRVNKINSVMASAATAFFNLARGSYGGNVNLPVTAMFDCRAFVTPSKEEAANYFMWREQDATKNSIAMAAHWKCGHAACQNKHQNQMQELLFQAGINYNDYPVAFKRGSYVRKYSYEMKAKDYIDINALPEGHNLKNNPDLMITRNDVRVIEDIPIFSTIANKTGFLFDGENAKIKTTDLIEYVKEWLGKEDIV